MKPQNTEILRMKIPEFIIVRTKTEEADTARRENPLRTYNNERRQKKRIQSGGKPRAFSSQNENRGSYIQQDDAKIPAETAQLDSGQESQWNSPRSFRTDMGLSAVKTFFRGENDIYVSPPQIRRFNLKTGDIVQGNIRIKTQGEKFSALLYVTSINGFHPSEGQKRYNFEDMTPIFPNERLQMERPGESTAMRIVDLISPIGKGQRG